MMKNNILLLYSRVLYNNIIYFFKKCQDRI